MRKNISLTLIFVLSALFLIFRPAESCSEEEYRFPQPEFSVDYVIPETEIPPLNPATEPVLPFFALLFAIAATGIFVYKTRSRVPILILTVISLLYFGFFRGGCVCAVGSIQNVSQSLVDRSNIIPLSILGFFLLPLLGALFFGRLFCAAACPLGAIQEVFIMKPVRVPLLIDRCLKLIPHLILGGAVLLAACNMGYIICRYDPFVGFFRASAFWPLFAAGGAILLLGTVVARPYCRYICPYSALLRIASGFSSRKVSVTPDECVVCHLCKDACPVGAIIPPRPREYPESKQKAVNRVKWTVIFTPVLVAAGIFAGLALAGPISRVHPDIRTLRDLDKVDGVPLVERDIYNREVTPAEAFFMKGGDINILRKDADNAYGRIRLGTAIFGGYIAIVFALSIISVTKRRANTVYTVDVRECVCCARCYKWCPRNKKTQGK